MSKFRGIDVRRCCAAVALMLTCVFSNATALQFGGRGFEGFGIQMEETALTKWQNEPAIKNDTDLLREHGIETDRESLGRFLDELTPDEQAIERGRELISLLGDPRYEVRVQATNELVRSTSIPGELFRDALNGDDPEQAFRCRQILEARKSSVSLRLQLAVFREIDDQKISGLIENMIVAFPQLANQEVRTAAARAIVSAARKEDTDHLKRAADAEDFTLRIAAIECLTEIDSDYALALMNKLSRSEDEELVLQIGRLYAQKGQQECLDIFLNSLKAENDAVRGRAYVWLRRITAQKIPFATWEDAKAREDSFRKWEEWIVANRDGLEIDFQKSDPKLGRILVGLYTGNKIVEFDMSGKQIWEAPLPSAFCCQGLPNGHRLVGQYSKGRIVEYDAKGELVKEFGNLPSSISSVERLENGNTLVAAGQTGNIVFELDPTGKRVWENTFDGTPVHASMLVDGKLLVSFNATQKVCEIDREGNVSWEVEVAGKPYSATRLLNGNTLVAIAAGGVIEFDSGGKKVREITTGANTYHAEELDDGNLIYADTTGINIIDPSGKKVRQISDYNGYLYLHYY